MIALSNTIESWFTKSPPLTQPIDLSYHLIKEDYSIPWDKKLKELKTKNKLLTIKDLLFSHSSDDSLLRRIQLWSLIEMLSRHPENYFQLLSAFNKKKSLLEQVLEIYQKNEKELTIELRNHIDKMKFN
jgi:hypothetical protein